jgi:hypothetical protein
MKFYVYDITGVKGEVWQGKLIVTCDTLKDAQRVVYELHKKDFPDIIRYYTIVSEKHEGKPPATP